jgi:transposase
MFPSLVRLKPDIMPLRRVWQEKSSRESLAKLLNLSYSTVSRWLKQFREEGISGLIPATGGGREPYTPERIIVSIIYFKCCVPLAADRELARVITSRNRLWVRP